MDEFNERYGDPLIIAQAYVKRVLEWPAIKSDKGQALDEFAFFLREYQYAVEDVKCMQVSEYSENLKIIRKLPYYLHDKWRNIVYDLKTRKEQLTFAHLVSFIRKEAKANDPIYGRDKLVCTIWRILAKSQPIQAPKRFKRFKRLFQLFQFPQLP